MSSWRFFYRILIPDQLDLMPVLLLSQILFLCYWHLTLAVLKKRGGYVHTHEEVETGIAAIFTNENMSRAIFFEELSLN